MQCFSGHIVKDFLGLRTLHRIDPVVWCKYNIAKLGDLSSLWGLKERAGVLVAQVLALSSPSWFELLAWWILIGALRNQRVTAVVDCRPTLLRGESLVRVASSPILKSILRHQIDDWSRGTWRQAVVRHHLVRGVWAWREDLVVVVVVFPLVVSVGDCFSLLTELTWVVDAERGLVSVMLWLRFVRDKVIFVVQRHHWVSHRWTDGTTVCRVWHRVRLFCFKVLLRPLKICHRLRHLLGLVK